MASTLRFVIETDATGGITGITRYKEALDTLGPSASKQSVETTSAFNRIEATLNKAKSAVIGFIAAVAFAEVIRGFRELINAGIEFEATFNLITRVLQGSNSDFEVLKNQMLDLSKIIPLSVNELNKIGGLGAQLGVPITGIKAFTEEIGKFSVATGVASDEAADSFARFGVIMKIPIEKMGDFMSLVVKLGNDRLPATEQEILKFSMNIASAGKSIGLSSGEIAALAATLASTGLKAEKAGSSVSRIMYDMSTAVQTGSDKLTAFAQISGMSSEQFTTAFKKDAMTTLLSFLQGLQKVQESSGGVQLALKAVGESNIRVMDTAGRAASATDFLTLALKSVATEAASGSKSMDEKFNKSVITAAAQLELTKNRIYAVAVAISDALTPSVVAAGKGLADLADMLLDNKTVLIAAVEVTGSLAIAFVGLKLVEVASGFELVKNAVFAYSAVAGGAATATEGLALALKPLALFSLITADIALAINAVRKWNQAGEDLVAIEESKRTAMEIADKTRQASIKLLREHNIAIVTEGRTIESIDQSIKVLMPTLKAKTEQEKKDAEALALKQKAQKIIIEDNKVYMAQVASMLKSLTKENDETKVLADVLMQAGAAGVKWEVIVRTFGKAIEEATKHTDGLNAVQKETIRIAAEQVEAAAKVARQQEVNDENMKSVNKRFLEQEVLLKNMNYAWDRYQQMLKTVGADIEEYNRLMTRMAEIDKEGEERKKALNQRSQEQIDLQNTLRGMIIAENPGMKVGGIDTTTPDAIKKQTEEGKAIIDQLSNDITRMFKNGIGHGKDFWESFKTMGIGAIASISSILFKDLLHDFLDGWAKKFGKWQDDFNDWIKDTLKPKLTDALKSIIGPGGRGLTLTVAGAAVGGAVGGKAGAVSGALGGQAVNQALSGNWVAAAILGIGAVGAAFVGMISSLHKEANKFVQGIQNPFASAVDDIFKGLTAAKDMGTLTVNQVVEAKGKFEEMWANFQTEAAKAGVVGQQALATMTPFVASWRDWLDSLGDAANNMERLSKVKDITDKITGAADGWDILEIAIQDMMDKGVDWGVIIAFLGSDIEDMAGKMKLLNIELPPAIKSIVDAIDAAKKMKEAVDRQAEVEVQLAQAREDLINALVSKLDYLDSEIQKATDNINKWKETIAANNTEIADLTTKLNDAEYWHKRYTSLIQDETDAVTAATNARKSAEEKIADLETKIQRDRLDQQLMAAKVSKKQTRIADAQAAIDAFEKSQTLKEMAARKTELAQLKSDLPGLIKAEAQAKLNLVDASIKATEQINTEKQDIVTRILNLQGENAELQKNIITAEAYIESLQKMKTETETMLEAIGGKRQTELEKIDDTITKLIDRGQALERERDALAGVTNIAKETVDWFHNLGRAMQEATGVTPGSATPATATVAVQTSPAPTPLFPAGPTNPGGIPTVPNGYISTDGMDIFGSMLANQVPSFEGGTEDTGPKPILALLHPHEKVLQAGDSGGMNYNPSVTVNLTINGQAGDMKRTVRDVIIPELLSALETNSSQMVQKFSKKLVRPSSALINK